MAKKIQLKLAEKGLTGVQTNPNLGGAIFRKGSCVSPSDRKIADKFRKSMFPSTSGEEIKTQGKAKDKPPQANKFLPPGPDGLIFSINSVSSDSNESISEQEIPYILTRKKT